MELVQLKVCTSINGKGVIWTKIHKILDTNFPLKSPTQSYVLLMSEEQHCISNTPACMCRDCVTFSEYSAVPALALNTTQVSLGLPRHFIFDNMWSFKLNMLYRNLLFCFSPLSLLYFLHSRCPHQVERSTCTQPDLQVAHFEKLMTFCSIKGTLLYRNCHKNCSFSTVTFRAFQNKCLFALPMPSPFMNNSCISSFSKYLCL